MNYETYLQHYGIKGMRWGIRRTPEQLGHKLFKKRYSNENGTLTRAGKKKLARELKKDYNQNYDPKDPFKTSSSYNKKLAESINKVITDVRKKDITDAFERYLSAQEEADKAEKTLDKMARKYGRKYYDDEIKRNPDAYTTPHDKQELREFADFEFGMDKAMRERPDLERAAFYGADTAWKQYMTECRSVSDILLGQYGDTKLSQSKDYSLRIKNTVDSMVMLMDSYHWDYKRLEEQMKKE